MIIKNIKNLNAEVTKEEWKKRVLRVSALFLGTMLTMASIPYANARELYKEEQKKLEQQRIEEEKKLEQQKIEEENLKKNISLLSCKVLVENFPDGTVKHHFVNYDNTSWEKNEKYSKTDYECSAITDKDFVVSSSKISYNTSTYFCYEELPATRGQYIYDYNVPYYIFDTIKLSLPEGYSLDELYSINDLKELEKKLDTSIYENKHEERSYYILFLFLAEVDGEFMCFDFTETTDEVTETTDKEDVTKLRNVYYVPSIGNNLVNLKISSGKNAIEDKVAHFNNLSIIDNYLSRNFVIDDITFLDQTLRNDLRKKTLVGKGIHDYLTEEQISNGKVTEKEILELLEQLNNQNFSCTR